jgi:hypothetical protein
MPSESALDLLAGFHSWQLNRISTTTLPGDVVVTVKRQTGQTYTDAEFDGIKKWVRTGKCYRCRIGKGRFFFGASAEEAARRAVNAQTGAKRDLANKHKTGGK